MESSAAVVLHCAAGAAATPTKAHVALVVLQVSLIIVRPELHIPQIYYMLQAAGSAAVWSVAAVIVPPLLLWVLLLLVRFLVLLRRIQGRFAAAVLDGRATLTGRPTAAVSTPLHASSISKSTPAAAAQRRLPERWDSRSNSRLLIQKLSSLAAAVDVYSSVGRAGATVVFIQRLPS